ncbi:MAG: hypothetical protein ACOC6J_09145 [Spirochaetota bacterium]
MEPLRIAFLGAGKRASYLYHRLISRVDERSEQQERGMGVMYGTFEEPVMELT